MILLLSVTFNNLHSKDFATLLENYFGSEVPSAKEQIDLSELQDRFAYYSEHKLNINSAPIKELIKLPLVSKLNIKILRKGKPFKTKLQLLNSIDSLQADEITKFVLKECLTIKTIRKTEFEASYKIRNKSTLQTKKGFAEGKYLGSPLNMYQKLNIKSNYLELYTVLDKDAGELYINDFTSASLKYERSNLKLIAGDYSLFYGLGNLLDQSFFSFKNADFVNTSTEFGTGGTQNKSTLADNFFRGIFAEYTLPLSYLSALKISGFYSNSNRSATIDDSTGVATSIYESGYFRTKTEVSNAGNLNEQLYGISAELVSDDLTLGIVTNYLKYANKIEATSFGDFWGKEGGLSSIYGSYSFKDNTIKFEVGTDANRNASARANFLTQINRNLSLLTDLRYADADYRAPYSSNFGEQPYVSNEMGILSGINYSKNNVYIALFADFYSSFNKVFLTTQPITGVQYYLDLKLRHSSTEYGLRVNYDKKSDAFDIDGADAKITQPNNKLTTRFDVYKTIGKAYNFKGRLEFSYKFNDITESEVGSLIQLELKKQFDDINLYAGVNYTVFNTSSFESVIYGYQYQVPGLAYVYPYYGKGTNLSVFAKYKFLEYFDLWLRYNYLYRNDTDVIGTGNEEIVGKVRSQVIFQLQFDVN
jgi:hypothetical protein